jgi:hypothetical protein
MHRSVIVMHAMLATVAFVAHRLIHMPQHTVPSDLAQPRHLDI